MRYDYKSWWEIQETGIGYVLTNCVPITEVPRSEAYQYDDMVKYAATHNLNFDTTWVTDVTGQQLPNSYNLFVNIDVVAKDVLSQFQHNKKLKVVPFAMGNVGYQSLTSGHQTWAKYGLKLTEQGWIQIVKPDDKPVTPAQMRAFYRQAVHQAHNQACLKLGVNMILKLPISLSVEDLKRIFTVMMRMGALKLADIQSTKTVKIDGAWQPITKYGLDGIMWALPVGHFNGPKQEAQAIKLMKMWLKSKVEK
jgi:hypothetical protein